MARYTIQHTPNFFIPLTCCPERQYCSAAPMISVSIQYEVECFIKSVTSTLPASKQLLQEHYVAQAEEATCAKVMSYCQTRWPEKLNLEMSLSPFWNARNSMTVHDNLELLLYNGHIVVPLSLQKETLNRLHEGHQGIVRCRMRTKTSVWWPGIASQVSCRNDQEMPRVQS